MPLSEHEQRILDEIEQDFTKTEVPLARSVRESAEYKRESRNAKWAIPISILGLVAVVSALWTGFFPLGVAGFLISVYGVLVVVRGLGRVRRVAQESIRERVESWSLRQVMRDRAGGESGARPGGNDSPESRD